MAAPPMRRLVPMIRRCLIGLVLALAAPLILSEEMSASELSDYFFVEKSGEGEEVLFIRRSPVVAAFEGFEESQVRAASIIASTYAAAAEIPITFSGTNANLVLVRAAQINRGDNVNVSVLSSRNFPALVIQTIKETTGWSSGCGVYAFKDRTGSISVSVGLIDQSLDAGKTVACIIEIISRSFGVGIRQEGMFNFEDGHFYAAHAIAVAGRCSKANPSEIQAAKACIDKAAKPQLK